MQRAKVGLAPWGLLFVGILLCLGKAGLADSGGLDGGAAGNGGAVWVTMKVAVQVSTYGSSPQSFSVFGRRQSGWTQADEIDSARREINSIQFYLWLLSRISNVVRQASVFDI